MVAAVLLVPAAPALAENLDHKFSLQGQLYFPYVDSSVRVDQTNGDLGTVIDFEQDLGLKTRLTLPAFRAGWRIDDDWMLIGEYYTLNRTSSKTIDRELTVGDTVYPVNARVAGGFDSDVYRFTINNLLFQRENFELALGIGFHGTDFRIFVEGEGAVGETGAQFSRVERTVFAPLPTLGAMLNFEAAPRLTLGARLDWLSLTIDDYSGRLVNTEASVAYAVHKNIDIGMMYRLVDYEVRVRKADWKGRVDYRFSGPALFLEIGF
jgi:hypothetical protein